MASTHTREHLMFLWNEVQELGEVLARIDYDSVFCNMTCLEAEALASVMDAGGLPDVAKHVIVAHSTGDSEEDDSHYELGKVAMTADRAAVDREYARISGEEVPS